MEVWLVEDQEDSGRCESDIPNWWFQTSEPPKDEPARVIWHGEIPESLYKVIGRGRIQVWE